MAANEKITPAELLGLIGISPADNRMGLSMALPWKSNFGGEQTKALFKYQQALDAIVENYRLSAPLLFWPVCRTHS